MLPLPFIASPDQCPAIAPVLLTTPTPQPNRESLRIILLGSSAIVRHTIHTLHVLNYVDQSFWSTLITVPETGIVITPRQGEVMSYLLRDRVIE